MALAVRHVVLYILVASVSDHGDLTRLLVSGVGDLSLPHILIPEEHMSTKKIEGIALMDGPEDHFPTFIIGDERPPEDDCTLDVAKATLIIHEGERERVYTESEVRVVVHHALTGSTSQRVRRLIIEEIGIKYGINL